jgi:hypothetical protein
MSASLVSDKRKEVVSAIHKSDIFFQNQSSNQPERVSINYVLK